MIESIRGASEHAVRLIPTSISAGAARAISSLEALGAGFLRHAANGRLRAALDDGSLDAQQCYRELLRLLYRLIFLFAAEDRGALLDPRAPADARLRYERDHSVGRLREAPCPRGKGDNDGDGGDGGDDDGDGGDAADALWRGLRFVMGELFHGSPALGLPALGSFLWSPQATPWLTDAECADEDLRKAIQALCSRDNGLEGGGLTTLRFADVSGEELGGLHERLLELHPRIDATAGLFALETAAGHERKTTGSYYTPASLVDCLLDSALAPVLDEAAAAPDPEAAILAIKVCDPACGSGRFLVAAARRIASRLASVRQPGGEPSAAEMRRALRDVAGRCVYGVDLSPIAVELCKISLWMEAAEPGLSLRFLEGHILHGNALLGATPALLARGIPDEAFSAALGDDKAVARSLKKRNKEARICAQPAGVEPSVFNAGDPADALFLADAWCAALLWPKLPGPFEDGAITEDVWRRLSRDPKAAPAFTRSAVAEMARRYAFFHWHLAFPEVFAAGGGFDVILGNPPWERITVSDEEWFARRDTGIAGMKGKPGRDQAIAALSLHSPTLHAAYRGAKRDEELLARFFSRAVGVFPLTGFGEVNTYHLFAELSERLVAGRGRVGLIVKTGIGSADSCLSLFTKLCAERRLVSLFDFVNTAPLFPGVQCGERFSLITFTGELGRERERALDLDLDRERPRPIRFAALCRDPQDLRRPGRVYALSPEDIALMSPKNGACPLLRGERDAAIMRRLYRSFRVLGDRDPSLSDELWNVEHAAIFHMSEASADFRRLPELLSAGARPIGLNRFLVSGEEYWPLYEGKYIHLLDHRHGTFEGVPAAKRYGRKAEAAAPPLGDLRDPGYEITPRYWFPRSLWLARAARRRLRTDIYFIYRDITGAYPDQRTAIGAIAAAGPAGNSCPCLTLGGSDGGERGNGGDSGDGGDASGRAGVRRLLSFAGLFCSIPFDYIVRNRLFSKHINPNVLGQLVMPPPRAAVPDEGERDTLRARLCEAALELSFTSESLRALGEWMGAPRPFAYDRERRFDRLREIDAIAAHMYGLSREDLEHILASFETLAAAETRTSGGYRTAASALAHYDRILREIQRGTMYSLNGAAAIAAGGEQGVPRLLRDDEQGAKRHRVGVS